MQWVNLLYYFSSILAWAPEIVTAKRSLLQQTWPVPTPAPDVHYVIPDTGAPNRVSRPSLCYPVCAQVLRTIPVIVNLLSEFGSGALVSSDVVAKQIFCALCTIFEGEHLATVCERMKCP